MGWSGLRLPAPSSSKTTSASTRLCCLLERFDDTSRRGWLVACIFVQFFLLSFGFGESLRCGDGIWNDIVEELDVFFRVDSGSYDAIS